ncbi:glycogen synthase [Mycena galericulata]|nr:glycogen synthase [Mycena galericulata]
MRAQGVKALCGRWLIKGAPHVFLFDTGSMYSRLDEWGGDLWNLAGIPSPPKDHETNETIVFGYLIALSFGDYVARQLTIALNNLQYLDVDHEAGKRGIDHRYCIERSATHCANHLLKHNPDGVDPHGLNAVEFQAMHEFQDKHATSKAKIDEFVRGHFYGHYGFDLDKALYMFTAGVDMFIEALARLNYQLQKSAFAITVVAFIIMPAATHSYTIEALKAQAITKQLRDTVTEIQNHIGARLFESAGRFHGDSTTLLSTPSALLSDEDLVLLKRHIFALKHNSLPLITTHNMADDANDPILNQICRVPLFNDFSDHVKIVFHPDFLNSSNPILGLDYEEFVHGTHLGMGIPSITTNLSGFGCFMAGLIERPQNEGCYIVDRRSQSVEDAVQQLADHIHAKSRQLTLRRAYLEAFANGTDNDEGEDHFDARERKGWMVPSMPASARFRDGDARRYGDAYGGGPSHLLRILLLTYSVQISLTSDISLSRTRNQSDVNFSFTLLFPRLNVSPCEPMRVDAKVATLRRTASGFEGGSAEFN